MTIAEYESIKGMEYLEYCDYLQHKYGIGLCDYMYPSFVRDPNCSRTADGLFAHHKMEYKAIRLSEYKYAVKHPFEWQLKENIVYCNYLEHMLLHILISERDDACELEFRGLGGLCSYIIPAINDVYCGWTPNETWKIKCAAAIQDCQEVYFRLLQRLWNKYMSVLNRDGILCNSVNDTLLNQKEKNAFFKEIEKRVFTLSILQDMTELPKYVYKVHNSYCYIDVDERNQKYIVINNCILEKDSNSLVFGINTSIIPPGVVSINDSAFKFCGEIENVIVPNSVVRIGRDSFAGCKQLKAIILSEGLKTIDDNAFEGCSRIKHLELPTKIERIGREAFSFCTGLQQIVIPASVIRIEDGMFAHCVNLQNAELPLNLTEIGHSAFWRCQRLRGIAIPDSVKEIGCNAFAYCQSLETVTIPEGVTEIKDGTFEACTALKKVIIPDSVMKIGQRAFADCNNLEIVEISSKLKRISKLAFTGCAKLQIIKRKATKCK